MVHRDSRMIGAAFAVLLLYGCQGTTDTRGPVAGPAAGPAVGQVGSSERLISPFGDYLSGRVAQAENDIANAAFYYARALEADPDNPDLLRRTLAAFLIAGRVDEAIGYAERLSEVDEEPDGAALTLAVADVADGDFDSALERLSDLPRVGFNTLLVPLLEAWAKFGAGDYEAARETLSVLSGNAAFVPIHDYHLALLSDLAGFEIAAETNYQREIDSLDGSSIRVVQSAGAFFERTGREEAARELYRDYREAHPDSTLIEAAEKRLDAEIRPERSVADARQGFAEALYGIALVAEAAVFGAPHPDLGQEVVAFVVPADRGAFQCDALLAECRQVLPGFMVPARIEVRDELPRHPNGKINRAALRDELHGGRT